MSRNPTRSTFDLNARIEQIMHGDIHALQRELEQDGARVCDAADAAQGPTGPDALPSVDEALLAGCREIMRLWHKRGRSSANKAKAIVKTVRQLMALLDEIDPAMMAMIRKRVRARE
jgi:hypothetical protein